jgi:hypothetical protein
MKMAAKPALKPRPKPPPAKPKPPPPKPKPKPPAPKPVVKAAAKPATAKPATKAVTKAAAPKPATKVKPPKAAAKPDKPKLPTLDTIAKGMAIKANRGHKNPPKAKVATRPPGTGVTPKPRTVAPAAWSDYDLDEATNQQRAVSIGEAKGGSELAILAMCCIGSGENHWSSYGCNGDSGCGCAAGCCGMMQIDCSKQAEHSYTDTAYWIAVAYDSGFYGYGGVLAIARDHPSYSAGRIANMCQGAYTDLDQGQAYYDRYLSEAAAIYDHFKGSAVPPASSGVTPSSPHTQEQKYDAGAAASFYHWPGNIALGFTNLDAGATAGSHHSNAAWDFARGKEYVTDSS